MIPIKIPTVILDDYHSDPFRLRELGLAHAKNSIVDPQIENSVFRGLRSPNLELIDKKNSDDLVFTLCRSVLGDSFLKEDVQNVKARSEFQLTDATWGEGWVHQDNNLITSILYLSPNALPESGTDLYMPKTPDVQYIHQEYKRQSNCSSEVRKTEEYFRKRKENNSQFIIATSIKNVFNRLIMFSGNTPHAGHYLFGETPEDSRLTLATFVYNFGPKFNRQLIY